MMADVRFTEEMRGYMTFGEPSCERGYEHGRASDTALMFHLTIDVDDVDALVADPGRDARARGYVHCEALGGRFPIERGSFNLFVPAGGGRARRMLYRLRFADGTGHPLTLSGVKRLDQGPPWRLWPETTTLFTRLVQGHVDAGDEPGAELVAAGILRIRAHDFARQLTTFRANGAGLGDRVGALGRFGRLFVAELASIYGPLRGRP
jgi:hypothetical protein